MNVSLNTRNVGFQPAVTIAGISLAFLCTAHSETVWSQDAASEVKRRGILQKIEAFQSSVKSKLDRALCRQCSGGESPASSDAYIASARADDGSVRPNNATTPPSPGTLQNAPTGAGNQPDAGQRVPSRLASERGDLSAPSNPLNAPIDPRQTPLPQLPSQQEGVPYVPRAVPPTVTGQLPPEPISLENPGDYSFDGESTIRGIDLGQRQVTATEHALRLMRENELLRASRQAILADNKRLRDEVESTKALLEKTKLAMVQATVQLESSGARNAELERKIVELEREHKRSLRETDQVLNAIREELDDVLVRELNATQ